MRAVRPNQIVATVLRQHAEDAAILHDVRERLIAQGHLDLTALHRLDDRIDAHLDGLAVAGEQGWQFCDALLEAPSKGALFTAGVRALSEGAGDRLDRLLAIAESIPETCAGLLSAFGWVPRDQLRGVVVKLLDADSSGRRTLGLAACAVHRVDPGIGTRHWLNDASADFRARAMRTAGELGLIAVLPDALADVGDDNPECRFWAAWASVMLGDRGLAVQSLTHIASLPGARRAQALQLALQSISTNAAHACLKVLASNQQQLRRVIEGSGIAGDPAYVPWLINHMCDDRIARLAGESFSLITGTDLLALQLDRPQPQGFESGPNDDPDDPNVGMDPDDGLPWPDVQQVENWWAANAARFQKGTRYFMGAPVTREHCIDVLKNGYQRQRILAAHYLCLLNPGTPLFNTSAPAWRQQRLLAKM